MISPRVRKWLLSVFMSMNVIYKEELCDNFGVTKTVLHLLNITKSSLSKSIISLLVRRTTDDLSANGCTRPCRWRGRRSRLPPT